MIHSEENLKAVENQSSAQKVYPAGGVGGGNALRQKGETR